MTPLVLAGATAATNYVLGKLSPSESAPQQASLPKSGFDAVLRRAEWQTPLQAGGVPSAESRLLQSSEVRAALSSLPQGASANLEIGADGSVKVVGQGGSQKLILAEETRALAVQAFSEKSVLTPGVHALSAEGVPVVKVPVLVSGRV